MQLLRIWDGSRSPWKMHWHLQEHDAHTTLTHICRVVFYDTYFRLNDIFAISVLWLLTSTVCLAQIGKPPNVSQSHTESEDGEEELKRGTPLSSLFRRRLVAIFEIWQCSQGRTTVLRGCKQTQKKIDGLLFWRWLYSSLKVYNVCTKPECNPEGRLTSFY